MYTSDNLFYLQGYFHLFPLALTHQEQECSLARQLLQDVDMVDKGTQYIKPT